MLLMFGDKASIMFSHLVNFAEMHADADGWFFFTQQQITDKVGYLRTQTEAALKTLNDAGLIEIGHRPSDPRRYFRISVTVEQLAEILSKREKKSQSAQTPALAPKTAPRAKQAANTPKETPNQSERPLEMVEPVGKTEQLPAEKPKKPKANTAEIDAAAVRLIEHFNAVAGTAFRTTGKANIECFGRVLKSKQGTEEEIRMVIELKAMQWANDPKMRDFLKPETLTRPIHFPKYLEECYNAKNQQSTPRPAFGGFAARDNNTIFNKSDARIAAMVMGQLQEHPGMANFLDPKFTKVEYLIALSESEIRHHLREAKRKWELSKYSSTNDDGLPF